MQIVLTNRDQKFAISPITEADFNGNCLKVTFRGNEVYCKPAAPGETYYLKVNRENISVIKGNIPSDRSRRIAWLLNFNTSDFCQSMDEYKKRSKHLQDKDGGYKSKHFVEAIDDSGNYAFLLAEKLDGRKYKPLLIYVNPEISKEKYQELTGIYSEYRQIHPVYTSDFIHVLLS